jgi:hypothetical protein
LIDNVDQLVADFAAAQRCPQDASDIRERVYQDR